MKVDRSRIPVDAQKQNGPLLDKMETDALAKLRDPKYLWAVCIHESAHGVYRMKGGATKLIFIGPHFVFEAGAKTVQVVSAGMSSEWPPERKYPGGVYLYPREMAIWSAAGWIWEKECCPESIDAEASADLDKARFAEDIRKIYPGATKEEIWVYWQRAEAEVRKDLKDKKIRRSILALAHKFENWLLDPKGETMDEIKQNENEPQDHYQLRYLLQEAKPIILPMFPDQQKKWVSESPLAQEISAILAKRPEYYEEFRALVGGIFPEPKS